MTARGLIIAAPNSGAGKTTVTLGILAALKRRGIAVRAAKAGPDYIDPAFHAAATGAQGFTLEMWAMAAALLDALMGETARDCELLVIEGVMGLFDGVAGPSGRTGAAADLAARFALPVVLVLDVQAQAQSAAAVVRGFLSHDPTVRIAGVVLNRVGSDRHRALVADAIAQLGVCVFSALPREDQFGLPGGYPELHAGALASAQRFQHGLARFAHTRPVHGECGGYMVLGEGIEDADGARHAMTGLLAHSTSFTKRKLHLGYREARLRTGSPLGPMGAVVRGHEFHYATLSAAGSDEPLAELADAQGRAVGTDGGRRGRVTGTFFHAIARKEID